MTSDSIRDMVHQSLVAGGLRNALTDSECASSPELFYDAVISLGTQPAFAAASLALTAACLSDFPVSASTVVKIKDFAEKWRTSKKIPSSQTGSVVALATNICDVIEAGAYEEEPVALEVPTYTAGPVSVASTVPPQFSNQPSFRPAVAAQRAKRLISLPQVSEREIGVAVEEMNRPVHTKIAGVKHLYAPLRIKDYVEQTKLVVSQQLLTAQTFVLHDYKADYLTNPAVMEASWVLIKIIMDAYVSRIPLMANFTFLREVSYAFIATFRAMVASQYFCVRRHAYNLLSSLATHIQLVDSLDAFAGSIAAIEAEVAWLARRLVEYQYLAVDHDERLWLIALKCCLFTQGSEEALSRVHPGALRSMMMLPSISTCHPVVFTRLTCAMHRQLAAASDAAVVADVLLHLGGEQGLVDLLAMAPTVESSAAVCKTIAITLGLMPPLQQGTALVVQAFALLEKLRVPWALHLLALGPSASKDLGQIVQSDVENHHDAKKIVGTLVSRLTAFVLEAASPPTAVRRAPVSDLCRSAWAMMREDTDPELRRTGVRFAAFATKSEWWDMQQRPRTAESETPATTMALELVKNANSQPRLSYASGQFLRRCCRMLAAVNPPSARSQLSLVLGSALKGPLTATNAMALYRGLLENTTVFSRTDMMSGDISKMILNGSLATYHSIVDGGVDAVVTAADGSLQTINAFWALYWALRSAEDSIASVRDARHVLIALIANSESQNHSWQWDGKSGVELWFRVLSDPHPPCAVIGAQVFNRAAAVEHYGCYEAVASEAARRDRSDDVLRNPFLLATSIHARIQQAAVAATPGS